MAAAAVLAIALGTMAHQAAHVVVGAMAGGRPTLVTSTGFEGFWSGLRNAGVLALGASGSLAHGILALAGWLVFRRGVRAPTTGTAVGWILFVTNAWIPTAYLTVSPVLGAGDWMPVLDRFRQLGPMRASAAVTGLFVAAQLWKGTVQTLARLVGNGAADARAARARSITRWAWAAGGLVAVLAAVRDPAGPVHAVPIAAAATFGSTWPILLAARAVPGAPVPGAPLRLERSIPVIVLAVVSMVVLVAYFGPGVRLD